jgi:hypothetical protein
MVEPLRTQILILLLMLAAFDGLAQKHLARFHMPTAAEQKIAERNFECVHSNKYSISQRLKFYPFNVSRQIRLVYFNDTTVSENSLPLVRDSIDYSRLIEIKTLTKLQVNKLTDVLYNIGSRAPNRMADMGSSCYNPHNAILFVDRKGHTFAFIEICFECMGKRESSSKIKFGEFCETKFELIKNYFGAVGVKTAVIDTAQ